MKKEKGTISILESIRNKMRKIEETTPMPTTLDEDDHDDFEYIDNSSKEIVDSKHIIQNAKPPIVNQELKAPETQIDDDFDFLSNEEDAQPEDLDLKTQNAMSDNLNKTQNVASLQPKNEDDLDLDLDLDEPEDLPEELPEEFDEELDGAEELVPKNEDDLNFEEVEDSEEAPDKVEEEIKEDDSDEDESKNEPDSDLDDLDFDLKDKEEIEEIAEQKSAEDLDDSLEEVEKEESTEEFSDKMAEALIEDNSGKDDEAFDEEPSEEHSSETQNTTSDDLEKTQNIASLQTQSTTSNMNEKTSIISQNVAQKASESIKELIQSIPKKQQLLQNPTPSFRSGETIEDMISAMLAPKLEKWMDENLPAMVEKIVREEIQKLIPKD